MASLRHKSSTLMLLVLAASLSVFAALLLTPSPSPAEPTVTWTPRSVNETILAGESKTVAVSFIASENLNNVVVRVVPALQPYVQANPASFGSINKGQTVHLNLILSAPATSLPGTFEGTVQLRSGSGAKKNFAKPLPVLVEVWKQIELEGKFTELSLAMPPGWVIREGTDERGIVLSNVANPSELSDFALQTEAAFFIRLLEFANPFQLPIQDWFDDFFSDGFSVDPLSKQVVLACGRDSIRIETVGIGVRVHLYIPSGPHVLDVAYGLFAPGFVDEYEAIVANLKCDV